MEAKRVLVVDDEFTSTEVLSLILRDEGYRVTVAANGRQALERIEESAPDLIVTDFMMPAMNGIEFARAVRADPRLAAVPIVLISGVSESALSAHRGHYDAFLRKPFKIDALLAAIASLLRGRK